MGSLCRTSKEAILKASKVDQELGGGTKRASNTRDVSDLGYLLLLCCWTLGTGKEELMPGS